MKKTKKVILWSFMFMIMFLISFIIGVGLTFAQTEENESIVEFSEEKFYDTFMEDSGNFLEKSKSLYNKYINIVLDKKEDMFNPPINPLKSERVGGLVDVLTGLRIPVNTYEAAVLYKAIPFDYDFKDDFQDEIIFNKYYFIHGIIINVVDNYYIVQASDYGFEKYFKFRVLAENQIIYEKEDKVKIIGQLTRFQELKLEQGNRLFEIPVFRVVYVEGSTTKE